MGDVDNPFGCGDTAFGEIEQSGAAGEQHGCGHGCSGARFVDRAGAQIGEISHDITSAASRTACDDVRIGAATAEIARHVFADFVVGARMAFADAGNGGHDLARRAVAALEGVMLEEGGLDRVEFGTGIGEPFDGRDRAAFDLRSQRQTGKHTLAVDMNGAGATLALIAAFLGAGEVEMIAQRIEKRHARFDGEGMCPAIDFEIDGGLIAHGESCSSRLGKSPTGPPAFQLRSRRKKHDKQGPNKVSVGR